MKFISNSEKETEKIAAKFAKKLIGGEVLAMTGDLGAGKTAFTKGLAKGLAIDKIVTSPTFVLMKTYKIGKLKKTKVKSLIHIDAYRLNNGDELEAIGVKDYFNDKGCVTVIEWSERVKDILPREAIKLDFRVIKDDSREIKITGTGNL